MSDAPDRDVTAQDPADAADMARGRLRLDKWLWYARFVKTRSLAAKLCTGGKIRISGGGHVTKASHMVKVGDVLTFPLGPHIRVIRVQALAARRGPAPEARTLYEDLSPPSAENRMERF
ncbi:RNA-binding S4 domain-containing protein [Indioceanicola profundi]|uniref:RNA-binding S4 domain-containing protein n=1 Tax=Indioceanicola profundi TaxID=2220096 RepID=UPI000E6AB9E7|nr:RNA-binding S4 domain-containing protein [Indioceanicola profundi]